MKIVSLPTALTLAALSLVTAAVVACADPNAVAGPPNSPDDAPTVNDPDTTAAAAGESEQPRPDAGRREY